MGTIAPEPGGTPSGSPAWARISGSRVEANMQGGLDEDLRRPHPALITEHAAFVHGVPPHAGAGPPSLPMTRAAPLWSAAGEYCTLLPADRPPYGCAVDARHVRISALRQHQALYWWKIPSYPSPSPISRRCCSYSSCVIVPCRRWTCRILSRDSRKPGGAAAGEAAPGGASRRNSGGGRPLPYCGGRVRSRIHVVWLLSLLVSGPTTNTSCPACSCIPRGTKTDTDSMWAGVRP